MAVNELQEPKYIMVEYEGKMVRQYPDGALRNERGQLVAQHPAGKEYEISTANARQYRQSQIENTQRAISEAVLKEISGIANIPARTPEAAYAFVVAKQTIALVDSDKPRMDDVEKLGQIMGLLPSRLNQAQNDDVTPIANALEAGFSVLESLYRDIMSSDNNSYRKHNVSQADAVDGLLIEREATTQDYDR